VVKSGKHELLLELVNSFISTLNLMDQDRIENLGRLMRLLSGNITCSVHDLAEMLGVSIRTVYRYIDTLKSAGFEIVNLQKTVFRLKELPLSWVGNGNVFYFTNQEVELMKVLVAGLDRGNVLRKGLRKKLGTVREDSNAWFEEVRTNASDNILQLANAIEEKRQVMLMDYDSLNSETVRNRQVEPYSFTSDLAYLWAYDLDDDKNKLFKIKRIGSVALMDRAWENNHRHNKALTDVFGFAISKPLPLVMKMTGRAKTLLVEQYPKTAGLLEKVADCWMLRTEVGDYTAPKSFCAGLAGEVEMVIH